MAGHRDARLVGHLPVLGALARRLEGMDLKALRLQDEE
jgi:hypothetical protein